MYKEATVLGMSGSMLSALRKLSINTTSA